MQSGADGSELAQKIPQLSRDWNPTDHALSPSEGFLLSRIDGHTTWMQLREIGGIPPDQVDACLERWISEGLVSIGDGELASDREAAERPRPAAASDPRIDPAIGLDEAMQRQILDFEASLDRSYFELLDVPLDADDKEIKRAYFRLSKLYHPDRYFRIEIGSYKPRLARIFRKLVEAYELLTDPATRAEIERTLDVAPPRPEPTPAPQSEPEPARPRVETPRKLTKRQTLDRLRRHFKLPEEVMAERRMRAAEFFKSALISAQRGRWSEAAPCIRLAIAFDPWNDEYRREFADVQASYQQQRAEQMLAESSDQMDSAQRSEALRILEEVLAYKPADAKLHQRIAELALTNGERDKAMECAQTACELEPESVEARVTYAHVLKRFGLLERARTMLNEAAELDPHNREVKAELLDMGRRRR